jgi:DNA-binding GntR family transcriptional regulator
MDDAYRCYIEGHDDYLDAARCRDKQAAQNAASDQFEGEPTHV